MLRLGGYVDYPVGPEEEEDYEARSALEALCNAEEIKLRDGEFIERISNELERKQNILSSIRDSLDVLFDGESEEDEDDYASASKDMNDFFARLQSARKKQMIAQEETPSERRRRIYKKGEPVRNGVLVAKFT